MEGDMTDTAFLDALHDHRRICIHVRRALTAKADALAEVGMDQLADFIAEAAETIEGSSKHLVEEFSADLFRQNQAAQAGAADILKTLLSRTTA
jgi:hypothetical protein